MKPDKLDEILKAWSAGETINVDGIKMSLGDTSPQQFMYNVLNGGDVSIVKKRIVCVFCGAEGHEKKDCPEIVKLKAAHAEGRLLYHGDLWDNIDVGPLFNCPWECYAVADKCSFCGELGHTKDNCPMIFEFERARAEGRLEFKSAVFGIWTAAEAKGSPMRYCYNPENYRIKPVLVCDFCKKTGHTRDKCLKIAAFEEAHKNGKLQYKGVGSKQWNTMDTSTYMSYCDPIEEYRIAKPREFSQDEAVAMIGSALVRYHRFDASHTELVTRVKTNVFDRWVYINGRNQADLTISFDKGETWEKCETFD